MRTHPSEKREAIKDGTIEAMSDALQLRAHKSNTTLDRSTSTSASSYRHHILLHQHVGVEEGEGRRGYAEAHGLQRLAASESQRKLRRLQTLQWIYRQQYLNLHLSRRSSRWARLQQHGKSIKSSHAQLYTGKEALSWS